MLLAVLVAAPPASASLTFVRSWGSAGTEPGQFAAPQGIAVDANGDVWVADTANSRIQHFDGNGNYLNGWGSYGGGAGQFGNPRAIAIAPNGTIFVADTVNGRIQKLDRDGVFQSYWPIANPLSTPVGVAVGQSGAIYVSDATNQRVLVFDANAAPLSTFGAPGTTNGLFSGIGQIALDPSGHIYVADANNHRVQKFNTGGGFTRNLAPPDGFGAPAGVAFDASGDIFASDSAKHRIVKFSPAGSFVASTGTKGTGDGQFAAPAGLAIRNDNLYVVETENNRVSQYVLTPDPLLGAAMTADPQQGTVLVKPRGSKAFVPLESLTLLPLGSVVDASGGTVRITATDGTRTFFADLSGGLFQLAQGKKRGASADMKLTGGSFKGCRAGSIRKLNLKGTGPFRTIGRYSTGTARGTTWLTDDQCKGTLTRVTQGSVSVRDNANRKTVVVPAGKRYFTGAK